MDLSVNFLSVSSAAHSIMYLSFDSAHLHYSRKVLTKDCQRKRSLSKKCRSQIHSKKYNVCVCEATLNWRAASFTPFSPARLSPLVCCYLWESPLSSFFVAVIPPKVQLYLHNPDLDGTLLSYFIMYSIKYPFKMTQKPSLLP